MSRADDASEWDSAWPEGAHASASGSTSALATPLRALADDVRETLRHVRAFPALALELAAEVRALESILARAECDVVFAVLDWRRAVAPDDSAGNDHPEGDVDAREALARRLTRGPAEDAPQLPAGVRVEIERARPGHPPRSWFDMDVLAIVLAEDDDEDQNQHRDDDRDHRDVPPHEDVPASADDLSRAASNPWTFARLAARRLPPGAVFFAVERAEGPPDGRSASARAIRAGIRESRVARLAGALPPTSHRDDVAHRYAKPNTAPAFALDADDDDAAGGSEPAAASRTRRGSDATTTVGDGNGDGDGDGNGDGDELTLSRWRATALSAVREAAVRRTARVASEYAPLRRAVMAKVRDPNATVSATTTTTVRSTNRPADADAPFWERPFGREYDAARRSSPAAASGPEVGTRNGTPPYPRVPSPEPGARDAAKRRATEEAARVAAAAKSAGAEVLKFIDWMTSEQPSPLRPAAMDAEAARRQEAHWRELRREQWRREEREKTRDAERRADQAAESADASEISRLRARVEALERALEAAERRAASASAANGKLRGALADADPFHPLILDASDDA